MGYLYSLPEMYQCQRWSRRMSCAPKNPAGVPELQLFGWKLKSPSEPCAFNEPVTCEPE